jgi:hypothetical protein
MLSSAPRYSICFQQTVRRESWLTRKNAETRCARVRRNPAGNIAALRAKEPARLSNWIATADTMVAREISSEVLAARKGTRGAKKAGIYREPF